MFTVAGFDLLGGGQKSSAGVIFATMSDWKYRTTQPTSINAMVGQTFGFAAQGVPEAMLRQAAQMSVCKINIDTDLRLAMTASVREYLAQNPSEFDPRKYLGPARDAIKGMVAHKIKNVLGSSNTL